MTAQSAQRPAFEDEVLCRLPTELDGATVERARRLRDASGERLHVVLVRLGLAAERDVAHALAEVLGLPLVGAAEYPEVPVGAALTLRFLKEYRLLPIAEQGDVLVVAMADPCDDYALRAVELATARRVVARPGIPAEIEAAIDRLHRGAAAAPAADEPAADEDDVERLKDLAGEAPVIRLVNQVISRGVEARASDIHFESMENRLRVRYRIDGHLVDVETPPHRLRAAVLSRVKLMARLNIAERRLPQDGRIRVTVRGRDIDLRVSTVPSLHGESVVLRVLDRGSLALDLGPLGFTEPALSSYLDALQRPNGILLVTGPTGSGKTTTLYASLLRINTHDRKILTVEDPIEYQLDGINQIQVKPQIGLSFAAVLRSLLRQDPDVMMIGEIRDLETAQIAVQAALTGHLVLSTLHTNGAAATVSRLLDMGVEDYLLVSTVNAIAAQRLVRTLCPHCRAAAPALPELVRQLRLDRLAGDAPPRLWHPVGCEQCKGLGFLGRTTIVEVLPLTDAIRRLVLRRAEATELHRAAADEGMRSMYEDGLAKALAGITTLEEVLRVTREG